MKLQPKTWKVLIAVGSLILLGVGFWIRLGIGVGMVVVGGLLWLDLTIAGLERRKT